MQEALFDTYKQASTKDCILSRISKPVIFPELLSTTILERAFSSSSRGSRSIMRQFATCRKDALKSLSRAWKINGLERILKDCYSELPLRTGANPTNTAIARIGGSSGSVAHSCFSLK